MSDKSPALRGRPRKTNHNTRFKKTALYKALVNGLPAMVIDGELKVSMLASATKLSKQTIYRSISEDSLTIGVARKIVQASNGDMVPSALHPFLPKDLIELVSS